MNTEENNKPSPDPAKEEKQDKSQSKSALLKEYKIEDPEVKATLEGLSDIMVRHEVGKSQKKKAEFDEREAKGEDLTQEKKKFMNEAYLRFLFVNCEVNIAKKHAVEDPVPNKINENMFIGSIGTASNLKELKKAGITHIVTCLDFKYQPFEDHFQYLHVPVLDTASADIGSYFQKALDFFEKSLDENKESKVFIHCFAGVSRSSTVAAALLISIEKINRDKALVKLKTCRPKVNPNQGFLASLLTWEQKQLPKEEWSPEETQKTEEAEEPSA